MSIMKTPQQCPIRTGTQALMCSQTFQQLRTSLSTIQERFAESRRVNKLELRVVQQQAVRNLTTVVPTAEPRPPLPTTSRPS